MSNHFYPKGPAVPAGICLLLLFINFFPLAAAAQGNLLVAPRRVVFEGPGKHRELNLANIGKDSARYDISLLHYRMKEDGSFEELKEKDPGIRVADSFIRFFPRTVTLAPNESQVVRIQLTNAGRLTGGEYRSHLYFRAATPARPAGETAAPQADASGITLRLTPVFGISVPVIIRVGPSTAAAALSQCRFERSGSQPQISLQLNRSGNMSIYGDLIVDHIAPGGAVTRVAEVKGIAVYTPNALRRVQVALSPAIDYSRGKLHVVFQAPENVNQNTMAQAEIYLQ